MLSQLWKVAGKRGTPVTSTTRRVSAIVLIAAAGFLLAFLIPPSRYLSVFGSTTEHKLRLGSIVKGRSDVLIPARGIVQMVILLVCGVSASGVALLGGIRRKPSTTASAPLASRPRRA